MTDRELMRQVLEDICGAKLCEINSMSSRVEMIRLMDKAITALRERLAQPEQPSVPWSAALESVWGEPEPEPVVWALPKMHPVMELRFRRRFRVR